MAWKPYFEKGITLFKAGKHADALYQLNQSIGNSGENQFILYDTRAAIYEALNNPKDALRDAKSTIKLAPQRWQGYARAARLFMKTHKFDASLKMAELALSYVKPADIKRQEELLKLKSEITNAQEAMVIRQKRMQNHMLKLPAELYNEIFRLVLAEDHTEIVTLLRICAHWRQIIWNSPALWDTLVLANSRANRKMSLWLERSNGRIRELHALSGIHSIDSSSLQAFNKIDWSYLRVFRIHHYPVTQYIDKHAIFRYLVHLEINMGILQRPDLSIFRSSSSLKSLTLSQAYLPLGTIKDLFRSLTSLNIEFSLFFFETLDDLFTLFHTYPQIESIRFKSNILHDTNQTPPDRLNLENPPSIEHLTTLVLDKAPWSSIILLLNIPTLHTLRLSSLPRHHIEQHLQHWISTSPKFLTELSLDNIVVGKPLVLEILRISPKLEILTLNNMFCNTIIQALLEPVSSLDGEVDLPCTCPLLRHLDVSHCPDVETSVVQDLVKQRVAFSSATPLAESGLEHAQQSINVNRLQILRMNCCERVDMRWLPWFMEHVPEVNCAHSSTSKPKQRNVARRVNGI